MSKIEKVKESINEMKSYLSNNNDEDEVSAKISSLADKGRSVIDKTEKGANEIARKVKEKKKQYENMDDKKKDRIWYYFLASVIAILAIFSFKAIKNKTNKED